MTSICYQTKCFYLNPINRHFDLFSEPLAKYIWFYMPMSVLLIINAAVFFVLCRMVCYMDREKREMGLKNQKQRSEVGER